MDDRTGQIYDSREAAQAAGVPSQHLRELAAAYLDDRRCARCGKPVKVRRNTPTKQGSDGRVYRWCNRCWYRKGVRVSVASRERAELIRMSWAWPVAPEWPK